MSAEYIVKVSNQSGQTQSYLLFNAPPAPSTSLGQVYTNVWLTAPGVASPRGTATFDIKTDNFAVCGTTPTPIGNGVVVSTADNVPVILASTSKSGTTATLAVVDGGPQFASTATTTSLANSFGIQTQGFDPVKFSRSISADPSARDCSLLTSSVDNIYCGYGKYDNESPPQVVPVAVWQANPSKFYEVTPVVTYYVSTGDYQQGTTVDITTLGSVVEIDFTQAQRGETVATVTQNNDGSYSGPVFSFPSK